MNAAAVQFARHRGAHLLLAHCAAMDEATKEGRTPAHERLAEILGGELAERLVGALAGSHARRPRELGT